MFAEFEDFEPTIQVIHMNSCGHNFAGGKWKSGNYFYIGRGSPLENPYSSKPSKYKHIQMVDTKEDAIKYFVYDLENGILPDEAYEALAHITKRFKSGKSITLVCFCKPHACHGDEIRKIILGGKGK